MPHPPHSSDQEPIDFSVTSTQQFGDLLDILVLEQHLASKPPRALLRPEKAALDNWQRSTLLCVLINLLPAIRRSQQLFDIQNHPVAPAPTPTGTPQRRLYSIPDVHDEKFAPLRERAMPALLALSQRPFNCVLLKHKPALEVEATDIVANNIYLWTAAQDSPSATYMLHYLVKDSHTDGITQGIVSRESLEPHFSDIISALTHEKDIQFLTPEQAQTLVGVIYPLYLTITKPGTVAVKLKQHESDADTKSDAGTESDPEQYVRTEKQARIARIMQRIRHWQLKPFLDHVDSWQQFLATLTADFLKGVTRFEVLEQVVLWADAEIGGPMVGTAKQIQQEIISRRNMVMDSLEFSRIAEETNFSCAAGTIDRLLDTFGKFLESVLIESKQIPFHDMSLEQIKFFYVRELSNAWVNESLEPKPLFLAMLLRALCKDAEPYQVVETQQACYLSLPPSVYETELSQLIQKKTDALSAQLVIQIARWDAIGKPREIDADTLSRWRATRPKRAAELLHTASTHSAQQADREDQELLEKTFAFLHDLVTAKEESGPVTLPKEWDLPENWHALLNSHITTHQLPRIRQQFQTNISLFNEMLCTDLEDSCAHLLKLQFAEIAFCFRTGLRGNLVVQGPELDDELTDFNREFVTVRIQRLFEVSGVQGRHLAVLLCLIGGYTNLAGYLQAFLADPQKIKKLPTWVTAQREIHTTLHHLAQIETALYQKFNEEIPSSWRDPGTVILDSMSGHKVGSQVDLVVVQDPWLLNLRFGDDIRRTFANAMAPLFSLAMSMEARKETALNFLHRNFHPATLAYYRRGLTQSPELSTLSTDQQLLLIKLAIADGNRERVTTLLQHLDPNTIFPESIQFRTLDHWHTTRPACTNQSLLQYAVSCNQLAIVIALLEHKAAANGTPQHRPLHTWASPQRTRVLRPPMSVPVFLVPDLRPDPEIAETLLKYGAEIDALNADGLSALHESVIYARYMTRHTNRPAIEWGMPAEEVCRVPGLNPYATTQWLLEHNANPNPDPNPQAMLHPLDFLLKFQPNLSFAFASLLEIMQLFLRKGAMRHCDGIAVEITPVAIFEAQGILSPALLWDVCGFSNNCIRFSFDTLRAQLGEIMLRTLFEYYHLESYTDPNDFRRDYSRGIPPKRIKMPPEYRAVPIYDSLSYAFFPKKYVLEKFQLNFRTAFIRHPNFYNRHWLQDFSTPNPTFHVMYEKLAADFAMGNSVLDKDEATLYELLKRLAITSYADKSPELLPDLFAKNLLPSPLHALLQLIQETDYSGPLCEHPLVAFFSILVFKTALIQSELSTTSRFREDYNECCKLEILVYRILRTSFEKLDSALLQRMLELLLLALCYIHDDCDNTRSYIRDIAGKIMTLLEPSPDSTSRPAAQSSDSTSCARAPYAVAQSPVTTVTTPWFARIRHTPSAIRTIVGTLTRRGSYSAYPLIFEALLTVAKKLVLLTMANTVQQAPDEFMRRAILRDLLMQLNSETDPALISDVLLAINGQNDDAKAKNRWTLIILKGELEARLHGEKVILDKKELLTSQLMNTDFVYNLWNYYFKKIAENSAENKNYHENFRDETMPNAYTQQFFIGLLEKFIAMSPSRNQVITQSTFIALMRTILMSVFHDGLDPTMRKFAVSYLKQALRYFTPKEFPSISTAVAPEARSDFLQIGITRTPLLPDETRDLQARYSEALRHYLFAITSAAKKSSLAPHPISYLLQQGLISLDLLFELNAVELKRLSCLETHEVQLPIERDSMLFALNKSAEVKKFFKGGQFLTQQQWRTYHPQALALALDPQEAALALAIGQKIVMATKIEADETQELTRIERITLKAILQVFVDDKRCYQTLQNITTDLMTLKLRPLYSAGYSGDHITLVRLALTKIDNAIPDNLYLTLLNIATEVISDSRYDELMQCHSFAKIYAFIASEFAQIIRARCIECTVEQLSELLHSLQAGEMAGSAELPQSEEAAQPAESVQSIKRAQSALFSTTTQLDKSTAQKIFKNALHTLDALRDLEMAEPPGYTPTTTGPA